MYACESATTLQPPSKIETPLTRAVCMRVGAYEMNSECMDFPEIVWSYTRYVCDVGLCALGMYARSGYIYCSLLCVDAVSIQNVCAQGLHPFLPIVRTGYIKPECTLNTS